MPHHQRSKASQALFAGLIVAAAAGAAPAQADPIDASFLSALDGAGINVGDPASTAELGQSVCSMLEQPAGTVASTVSSLTGSNGGMSPEMAGLFTDIAVATYCPEMVSQLASGQLPNLPQIPGLPSVSDIPGVAGLPINLPAGI